MGTGGKGEPVAINARPSVHAMASSGSTSQSDVGLDMGNCDGQTASMRWKSPLTMMGRSTCLAISLTMSSVKERECVDVPIRTVGFTALITDESVPVMKSCLLTIHQSNRLDLGCLTLPARDLLVRPSICELSVTKRAAHRLDKKTVAVHTPDSVSKLYAPDVNSPETTVRLLCGQAFGNHKTIADCSVRFKPAVANTHSDQQYPCRRCQLRRQRCVGRKACHLRHRQR